MTRWHGRTFSHWAKRVGLMAATLLLTIVAVEVVLALAGFALWPRTYVGQYSDRRHTKFVADADVGWRMRPTQSFVWTVDGGKDTYYSDARGFRTYEDSAATPQRDGALRIAVAGDSFLWGVGVGYAETSGALIERTRPAYRVDNLAMPGFGLDQIWLAVRHWALPMRPNVVIVGIYAEDLGRSLSAYRIEEGFNKPTFKLSGSRLVRATAADRPSELMQLVERRSRLLTLWRRVEPLGGYFAVGEWWSLNAAILDIIREDCRRAGTRLVFVHIPHRRGGAIRPLTRYMNEAGAEFIDLADLPNSDRQPLYFRGDGHLNESGHRKLAALLVERLDRNGHSW